jgi:hypothetical protein
MLMRANELPPVLARTTHQREREMLVEEQNVESSYA